jgi:hypothetical protein
MPSQIDVEQELRELGRTLVVAPPPDDLAERVIVRVRTESARRSRLSTWWHWLTGSRRRLVAAIVAAVLIGLVLTPPVRAAVVEWLRIGGVLIRSGPPPAAPSVSPQPIPPASGSGVSLDRAQAMVDFSVGVPAELGAPDYVSVSADRRVVSMEWGSGRDRIHLDQFDGTISWVFVKQVWSEVIPTAVNGRDAAWIADTHEIVYTDRDGTERRAEARISGPCLVWERLTGPQTVTLRMEGDLSLERAVAIAESVP